MSLQGADDHAKLNDLCTKTFKEQAIWFLNSFWEEYGATESEFCWECVQTCEKVDVNNNGVIDEFEGHRFLELMKEEMTVLQMRKKLRDTGAIDETDRPKTVPLIHYLVFRYGVDWHFMVNCPQGSREEIEKAQQMLESVQAAFKESQARDAQAAAALIEAQNREREAKEREEQAVAAEAEAQRREAQAKEKEAESHEAAEQAKVDEQLAREKEAELQVKVEEEKTAKAELEAALAEVKAQEDAYNAQIASLKKKSTEGGVVSQGKAKNELAQLLGEDPLPLRRAKITLEAAVRRADRATQEAAVAREESREAVEKASKMRAAAEEAAQKASQARADAEEASRQATQARSAAEQASEQASRARAASEEAKAAAAAALAEAKEKLAEAEAYLEEAKNRMPQGAAWWLERELHEQRAYLPQKKGGYKK